MIPFPFSDSFLQRQLERQEAAAKAAAGPAVPWTHDIKWKPAMHIQAESYQWYVRDLFPELPAIPQAVFSGSCVAYSPSTRFCYSKKILQAGGRLATISGRKRGFVFFDGPVMIPMLFERRMLRHPDGSVELLSWPQEPWMSLTPMELITLRAGTKLAKGHTIVAGLGLGHQLIEVSHKPTVTAITLVEKDPELIAWLLPRVHTYMDPSVPLYVMTGNAYTLVPEMTADTALIDIFPHYGGNKQGWLIRTKRCPGIKRVWVWGG